MNGSFLFFYNFLWINNNHYPDIKKLKYCVDQPELPHVLVNTANSPHCCTWPQAAHKQAHEAGGGGVGEGGGPEGGMTRWEAGGTSEAGVRTQGVGAVGLGGCVKRW